MVDQRLQRYDDHGPSTISIAVLKKSQFAGVYIDRPPDALPQRPNLRT